MTTRPPPRGGVQPRDEQHGGLSAPGRSHVLSAVGKRLSLVASFGPLPTFGHAQALHYGQASR